MWSNIYKRRVNMEKKVTTPLTLEKVKELKAGDSVLLSGYIYTSRDAGHKRMVEL
jgi:fumarate hydratase subunit beta